MNVEVVYCCPTSAFGSHHWDLACEFAETLYQFKAGFPHKFIVISNGGKPDTQTEMLFAPFKAEFFERVNLCKDIGAWQHIARDSKADLMVFLGGSTYIRGRNWLKRVVDSFKRHGNGLYGSMVNTGDPRFEVAPHIRTTGFWMPPALMNEYPVKVTKEEQRYPFEHGPNCLTSWVAEQGLPVLCTTWQGEFEIAEWGRIGNGFHQGNQSGLIFGDHLSRPPHFPHA